MAPVSEPPHFGPAPRAGSTCIEAPVGWFFTEKDRNVGSFTPSRVAAAMPLSADSNCHDDHTILTSWSGHGGHSFLVVTLVGEGEAFPG
jgi:hypothetical protein